MNLFETAKSVDLSVVINNMCGTRITKHKPAGHSCPLCNHNGCFSVFTNNKTGDLNYKCFSCGSTGDVVDFVKSFGNFSSQADAAKEICNMFGLTYEEVKPTVDQKQQNYFDIYEYCTNLFSKYLLTHSSQPFMYFKNRGLSEEIIKKYRLGYIPPLDKQVGKDGKLLNFGVDILLPQFSKDTIIDSHIVTRRGDCLFNGRFIFPILNSKGKPIAFAGRSIDDNTSKYVNTSATDYFNKSYTLFNYDVARKFNSVYVVEGYMDALSLVQAGVPNVVAAMGTAFGDTHLSCLKGKSVTLALDNDIPGQSHTYNIIMNHKDIPFEVVRPYTYKDFNEALLAEADVKKLVNDTVPAPLFVIKHLASSLDLKTVEARKELWKSLATLIGSPVDDEYRKLYPLNTLYTPYEHDYYWTIANRIVKGKRLKKGGN